MLTNPAIVVVSNISVLFDRPGAMPQRVLHDVGFVVDEQDLVCIVGTNGSGKTTLLRVLAGVLSPASGTVWFGQSALYRLPRHERCRRISQVTQVSEQGCATRLTVEENLTLALLKGHMPTLRPAVRRDTRERILRELSTLQLGDLLIPRLTNLAAELSGGERQALVLAMAIIQRPDLLLLDEHTASLDASNRRRMNELTASLVKQEHITTIMVSHDLEQIMELATKILVLDAGRLVRSIYSDELKSIKVEDLRNILHLNPRGTK
jgi:putative ABC transport system ATP-binding protein